MNFRQRWTVNKSPIVKLKQFLSSENQYVKKNIDNIIVLFIIKLNIGAYHLDKSLSPSSFIYWNIFFSLHLMIEVQCIFDDN